MIRKIKKLIFFIINKHKFGILGFKSYVEKPLYVCNKKNIFLGKSVSIRKFSRLEPVVRWGKVSYEPKIEIGDNVNIEQCLHLTCANHVSIGSGTVVTPFVVITDIKHQYDNIEKPILEQGISYSDVVIGEDCFIGSGARILPGTIIGKHCIIGANAVVQGKYDEYSVIAGNPAKVIKKYDLNSKQWVKISE